MSRNRTRRIRTEGNGLVFLFFYARLVEKHDGDVVLYRVHALALLALEPRAVVHEADGYFAVRADQNLEQRGVHGPAAL